MEHGYKWSSKTDVWLTPPDIVERVRSLFGGPPDLDPASSEASNVFIGARRVITRRQNALEMESWVASGQTIWMNPPGGVVRVDKGKTRSVAGMFWARLMEERDVPEPQRFKDAVVMGFNLEFLRTSQNYAVSATRFPFVIPQKRLRFWTHELVPGTSPSHASVIVYVPGQIDRREQFLETFGPMGAAVDPGRFAL